MLSFNGMSAFEKTFLMWRSKKSCYSFLNDTPNDQTTENIKASM